MKIITNSRVTGLELATVIFVFVLSLTGIVISWINTSWFEEVYVVEDGFIEWLTVLALVATFCIAINYLIKLFSRRNLLFCITLICIAAFCGFAAGEEISWGQRIFDIRSSEYFKAHNSQQETNLHNLVIDGKRVNKIVFSQILIALASVYLAILPIVYLRSKQVNKVVDYAGIPVPRLYQTICCVGIIALSAATPSDKGSELLEFGGCFMFALIVLFPRNKHLFRPALPEGKIS